MTHGPKSELDLAADRLKAFMDKHGATLDEMQKLLGILKLNLQMILERRTIATMWAGEIVLQLGSDMLETTIAKLNKLREPIAPETEPEDAGDQEEAPTMPVTTKTKTPEQQVEQIDAAMKSAMKRLDTSISGLCRALKKGDSYLANAKRAALDGQQKPAKTSEIIAALDALTKSDVVPTKTQEKPEPPIAASEAQEKPTEKPVASEDRSEAKPTSETHPDLAQAWVKQYMLDEFGIGLEELEAIVPIIEHAIVARRHGIRCRLVIDDIEARP